MEGKGDGSSEQEEYTNSSSPFRPSEGTFSQLDESVSGLASSCTNSASNTAIGLRARLWRVDHSMWKKFTGQARDDEENELNLLRNVSSAYNSNVHIPQKSRSDSSVCGLPVIDPYSWVVSVWTRFIILFDMSYTAFLVPISVGFQTNEVHKWNGIIDIVAGVIFVLALFMGFHIGFIAQYNLRRVVVKDGTHVASYYMQRGTFSIDLISVAAYMIQIVTFAVSETVGIDQSNIVIFWVMNAIQVLRMVRLCSVFGVVKYLLISASTGGSRMVRNWLKPAFLYTAVIAYMLAFVVNATASLWFYVGSSYSWYNHDNWIAKFLGLDEPCVNVHFAWQFPNPAIEQCPDTPVVIFYEAFFMSIYWSVTTLTTVGYGDVTPSNIGEVIVAIIVMLIGIMSFAVLIGSMQEVFKNASDTARNVSVLREKLEAVDTWLQKRRIPKSIQSQVRRFYHEAWLQREQDYMESEIFEELPHQLRAVVAQHQTCEMLGNIRVFKSLSAEERRIVASKLVPVTLGVGQDICSQGDFADRMWIMQEGTMVAMYGDKMAEVEKGPTLICETAILADVDPQFEIRPCGYRSATTCLLWQLKMRDLRALIGQFPYLKHNLDREVSQHVLERAGLHPDGVGGYNMDIVRDTAKHLQMDATKGVSTNSVEGLAPVSDAPGPYARQESISLSGVGEVPVQCLENLATQVNHAVQGSAYGSPAKRGDSVAEVQVDAKMMDGGAEGEAGPRLSPLIVNTSPEKRAHGEGSPSASALGADSSNVSAALREILRYIKGMEARLSEMEAATPASASGSGRPRFGSPLKRLGSSSASTRHPPPL